MCCYDKLSIDGGPLVHCVACHQCLFRYRICRTPMHTSMMRRGTLKIVLLGIFIDHTTHTKQLYIFAYTLSMTFRCFHNWIWLCMLWEDRIHPLDPVHYHFVNTPHTPTQSWTWDTYTTHSMNTHSVYVTLQYFLYISIFLHLTLDRP